MGLFKCHKHDWIPIGAFFTFQPVDRFCVQFYRTTCLHLLCSCGKTNDRQIANWKMTTKQVKTYIKEVYGDDFAFTEIG